MKQQVHVWVTSGAMAAMINQYMGSVFQCVTYFEDANPPNGIYTHESDWR